MKPWLTKAYRHEYHSESFDRVPQSSIFQSFSTKNNLTCRKLPKALSSRLFTVAHIYKTKLSASIYFYFVFSPSRFFCLLTHTHGNCRGLGLCVLLLAHPRLLFDVLLPTDGSGTTQESGCLGTHQGCYPQQGWPIALVPGLLRSRATLLPPVVRCDLWTWASADKLIAARLADWSHSCRWE